MLIQKIKKYFKTNKRLRANNDLLSQDIIRYDDAFIDLSVELDEAKKKIGDPRYVVEKVLKKGIKYFDYSGKSFSERKIYYEKARAVLGNDVLKNEINTMLSDWIEFAAKASENHMQTRDIRMQISALSLLQERLSEIQNPETEEKKLKEPFSGI